MSPLIWFDTTNFWWFIVYILNAHRLRYQNYDAFKTLKIVFMLDNSAYYDEMPHSAFQLGLY